MYVHYNAEAEMRAGDGSLSGQRRLLQSIPRDQADNTVKGPVMIDVRLDLEMIYSS